MMIKNPELALDSAAELFLTAFNGGIFDHGALVRLKAVEIPGAEARWFRQAFAGPANFDLFVGVSTAVSAALPGDLTDLLSTTFQTMARALSAAAGASVICRQLTEEAPLQDVEHIICELRRESIHLGRVTLSVPESALTFLGRLIQKGNAPAQAAPRHLDALMNVDLPVSISFGTTEMLLADVLKLTAGSIVEFNHPLNEPVNIIVNDCLIARGDVVVVEGNYGVRISEVMSNSR